MALLPPILIERFQHKFFDSLNTRKPVLLNYSGWQRDVFEANNAGYGCKLYNMNEFVKKVLYLNSHKGKLVEVGQNARRLAFDKFDRDILASEVLDVLESVVKRLMY